MTWWPKTCQRLLLSMCLFFPPWVLASDDVVWRNVAEGVSLVSGPHYPPFSADYLPHNGLAPFLAKRVFEASGRSVTLSFRPWKRAYRDALHGMYDAILPYIETPDRRKEFLFSEPMFEVENYIYVRSDSQINAQSLKDMKGKTYCSPLGFADGKLVDQMLAEGTINRVSVSTLKNCFQMLLAGRVDFIPTNRYVADYMGRHRDVSPKDIRALPFVIERLSLHMMVPRNHPHSNTLIDTFNRHYRAMARSGRIAELTREYLERINAQAPPSLLAESGH